MKLLLASDGDFLFERGYSLLNIPKNKISIAYITTASKAASNKEYVKFYKKMMADNGYKYEELDIENKTEEDFKNFFKDKNIIYMEGGNTFYLLKAIKKSGFDKVLRALLEKGIIYVGVSAGSAIMGPTIEASSHVPDNISKEDLKALGYVPFLIKAHYIDNEREGYLKKIKNINHPLKFLRDGQGILVENGKYTFVGEGEEVKLP